MVVSLRGKHKWLKAGTKQNANILKRQIDSLEESQRIEKLGLVAKDMRIDDFFQKFADYIKIHASPNTVKRYLSILNTFLTYLKIYQPTIKLLSQIKTETIENYQQKRITSFDLKKSC